MLTTKFELREKMIVPKFTVFSTEYWDRQYDIAKKEPWPKRQWEDLKERDRVLSEEGREKVRLPLVVEYFSIYQGKRDRKRELRRREMGLEK